VLSILASNSIFNVLNEKTVKRQPIEPDKAFEPVLPDGSPSGIEVLAFAVPGKGAWYLEGKTHPAGADGTGDTLGLRIGDRASGKHFYFLAACAHVTDDLKKRIAGASAIFFDGTVWRDDELAAAGLGNKTGQGMGHIAMSGERGAIESLDGLDIDRKMFLHINNSNPAWLRHSAERKAVERAGWQIPADGTEFTL
jgi:pyrroloquinoline quinone biosynthesis protein B